MLQVLGSFMSDFVFVSTLTKQVDIL